MEKNDKIIIEIKKVKQGSLKLASLNSEIKNKILLQIADDLINFKEEIFIENKKDLDNAVENKIDDSLIKRLKLDDDKLNDIVKGLKDLVLIEDPIGKTLETIELDDDFLLYKIITPLGVVASIFESRPDALVQIFSLCFKSGNGCVLKGGKEAFFTNKKLYEIILNVTDKYVEHALVFLKDRDAVNEMLKLHNEIDLLIPRGSSNLVNFVKENSKIPILGHSLGLCHAYVDKEIDIENALNLIFDAKTQYPAACNAIETLLVHEDIASTFIPMIGFMFKNNNVEMRGCSKSVELFEMNNANDLDWETEYNDLIISIKIVSSINEAIDHINKYGSKHSEMIVTESKGMAKLFENSIDASSIMWNCSTRFADGFRYGKGAETGISTGKIHARGPVGLEGLVIYKYILEAKNKNATVKEYNIKGYKHKRINKEWLSS
jgi:glutamate-5-semialdehyde dehydrogenase